MSLLDFFKKKKTHHPISADSSPSNTVSTNPEPSNGLSAKITPIEANSPDSLPTDKKASVKNESFQDSMPKQWEFHKKILDEMRKEAPSKYYVSGVVFDIVRSNHDIFSKILFSSDALELLLFFANSYIFLLKDPYTASSIPNVINPEKNDTDPKTWNTDIFLLSDKEAAGLCYIPIENDKLDARMIGIIASDKGDGYYYCMLNKGEDTPSIVTRNKAWGGTEEIGSISGRGFDLMNAFLNLIKNDFYENPRTPLRYSHSDQFQKDTD